MKIGEAIHKRRTELGLTLEDVGKYIGVSKSTVKKWETGYISNMRRDKIALLARILQVDPSSFIVSENQEIDGLRPMNSDSDDDTYLVVGFGRAGGPKKVRSPKDEAIIALEEAARDLSVEEIEAVIQFARFTKDQKNKG